MSWVEAEKYQAIIGGCYFLNVSRIIEHNNHSLIRIKRNTISGQFGIDADILDANGNIVAEIRNDTINIKDCNKYQLLNDKNRLSIVETNTGKIFYDFNSNPELSKLNFQLSIITHLPNGLPVFLHPNRIKIGAMNILKPHMTSIKLKTKEGAKGPAIKIKNTATTKSIIMEHLHMPSVPMIGEGGVVAKLLSNNTDQVDSGMSTLMMYGENNQAAHLLFEGPCYFLDTAFEDFETAVAIESTI